MLSAVEFSSYSPLEWRLHRVGVLEELPGVTLGRGPT